MRLTFFRNISACSRSLLHFEMENSKIVELLSQVVYRLDNLVTKLDDNGLLSMTRIARNREESLENYRKEYTRQYGVPSSPVVEVRLLPTSTDREACDCGCSPAYYDEID